MHQTADGQGVAAAPGDEQPRPADGRRIDRRRDLAAWVTTPLVTLLVGPVIGFCVTALVFGARHHTSRSIECTRNVYRDESDCFRGETLVIEHHAAAFLIGWVLLWLLPWWRGLRRVRLLVAVLTVLPLLLLPVRLLGMPEW